MGGLNHALFNVNRLMQDSIFNKLWDGETVIIGKNKYYMSGTTTLKKEGCGTIYRLVQNEIPVAYIYLYGNTNQKMITEKI